jgi:hypothetical protein
MKYRQLFVKMAIDGTVICAETREDTPVGRGELEAFAFRFLERPEIASAWISAPVERIAQTPRATH